MPQKECRGEEIDKMNEKSLLEIAYDFVNNSKNPVTFKQLWAFVVKEKELSAEEAGNKVSQFYTTLLLDGRFVTLGENTWDLRERHTFDKVHIDMRDVYNDVEADDDHDIEEESENKEYNEVFEEPSNTNKDGEPSETEEAEENTADPYQ